MPILYNTQLITLTAGGGTENLNTFANISLYIVQGSATLTSNWTIQSTGTLTQGLLYKFKYEADIDLDGNTITFFGTTMPETLVDKSCEITAYYDGTDWEVNFVLDVDEDGSIPLDVLEQNPFRPIPAVSEVMVNGDDSPIILNAVQGEGTTASVLHYRCDPVEKVLEIIGSVDVYSVDETAVAGDLKVMIMTWGTEAIQPSDGAAFEDRYPLSLAYTLNATVEPNSIKGGYISKTPNFTGIHLTVPSGSLGTDTNCSYRGKVNLKFRYL